MTDSVPTPTGLNSAQPAPEDVEVVRKVAGEFGTGTDRGQTNADVHTSDKGALSGTDVILDREHGPSHVNVDDDAMLPSARLAELFGVDAEALRKRLERWRKSHGDGWIENTERNSRQPQYLYRVGAVRSVIGAMKGSGGASTERPAPKS